MRLALVVLAALSTARPALGSDGPLCTDALQLDGPDAATLSDALRGHVPTLLVPDGPPPPDDCVPASLVVRSRPDGLDLDLTLPWGATAHRTLTDPADAVAWVDSTLRRGLYTDLLTPDPRHPLALYATWEDLAADRPTGTVEVGLLERAGIPGTHLDAFDPVVSADLPLSEGGGLGPVFAFRHGGTVYVNPRRPKLHRGAVHGPLTRHGDLGLFPRKDCRWMANPWGGGGQLVCHLTLVLLDLTDGSTLDVTRPRMRRWLAADPALQQAWLDEKPKHTGVRHRYLDALLQAHPDALEDRR